MRFEKHVNGSLQNNSYILFSEETQQVVIIDPSDGIMPVLKTSSLDPQNIGAILITHAHFDHILGCIPLLDANSDIKIFIHPLDLDLWKVGGGAALIGMQVPPLPEPTNLLEDKTEISFSDIHLDVLHTPGHSPGHVCFYCQEKNTVFCGDLIFRNGIGRTDRPGGSYPTLINSIQTRILTLPAETLLYPGHGPATSVEAESKNF